MAVVTGLAPTVIAVMWVQTTIGLFFVVLRLYTRWRLLDNIGLDDHLSWISMLLFVLYTLFITIAAMNGLGSHFDELNADQFAAAVKYEIIGQTMNILAIATSKSSVAVFLIRIVNLTWHKWMLYFCIFSTCFVCVSCIILMYAQCTPVESIWDHRIPTKCHDYNFTANAIFSGSYTAAMDFWLATFPWTVLWTLNMRRKERLTVSFGLSLGVLAGVCGVVRAVELNGLSAKADYLYATVPLIIWGSTELLVCLLCATIPVLRPFYKKVRGKGSSTDPYSHQQTGNKFSSTSGGSQSHGKLDSATKSRLGIKLSTWRNRGTVSTVVRGGVTNDNASDQSALFKDSGDGGEEGRGIVVSRVTEVDVAYSHVSESRDGESRGTSV